MNQNEQDKKADKNYQKRWRNVFVQTFQSTFDVIGLEAARIRADCLHLQEKHRQQFTSPEEVQAHLEYVLAAPSEVFPASKEEYRLVVRSNGGDKCVVVDSQPKQGNHQVISAYTMDAGQLETKRRKRQESQLEGRPSSSPASPRQQKQGF